MLAVVKAKYGDSPPAIILVGHRYFGICLVTVRAFPFVMSKEYTALRYPYILIFSYLAFLVCPRRYGLTHILLPLQLCFNTG